MRFSKHFLKNWTRRMGIELPTEQEFERLIRESVLVQSQKILELGNGFRHRGLAIYWHPVKSFVAKIDHMEDMAVSVLSIKNMRRKNLSV